MRWLALLALGLPLCACKTTHSSESESASASSGHVESSRELHGASQTFTHTLRVAERFAPDGGVAARVVTDTATGVDRSFVGSSLGTAGAETNTATKAEAKSTMAPGGCLGLGLGGVLGLAALAGAVWLYRRYKP